MSNPTIPSALDGRRQAPAAVGPAQLHRALHGLQSVQTTGTNVYTRAPEKRAAGSECGIRSERSEQSNTAIPNSADAKQPASTSSIPCAGLPGQRSKRLLLTKCTLWRSRATVSITPSKSRKSTTWPSSQAHRHARVSSDPRALSVLLCWIARSARCGSRFGIRLFRRRSGIKSTSPHSSSTQLAAGAGARYARAFIEARRSAIRGLIARSARCGSRLGVRLLRRRSGTKGVSPPSSSTQLAAGAGAR